MKRIFFYLLIIPYLSAFCQESNPRFKHLTVDNGLSQSWIRSICQDKFGFLWIGTDDGLNRYDGYDFYIYKYDPRVKFTINSNTINCIIEDITGNLWVGTTAGLNLYDRTKNNFVQNEKWPDFGVTSFATDKNKNLWMSTDSGLHQFNLKNNKLEHYIGKYLDYQSLNSNLIFKVYIDSKDKIWIITEEGLFLIDPLNGSIRNVLDNLNDSGDPEPLRIYDVLEDSHRRIWLGTTKGLKLYSYNQDTGINTENIISVDLNSNIKNDEVISFLFEDNKQRLWVGTEHNGIYNQQLKFLNENKLLFNHYLNNPNNPASLSNNSINYIYQDNQNNIWIGTFGNGLNLIKSIEDKFIHEAHEPNNNNSLNNNQVNVFFDDGDYLWIGTEGGLNRFDKKTGSFKHFVHNPSDKNSIGSDAVWAICKDKQSVLWIGTWAGGLNRFNEKTETFTHYYQDYKDPESISSNNIFALLEDSKQNFWIGTMGGGLNLFNREDEVFIKYTSQNTNLPGNYIEQIIETKRGDLWLANTGGLVKFDRETGKCLNYFHFASDSSSISNNRVFTIYEDHEENLWIGTPTGLNLFNYNKNTFFCYQIKDGLPDNSVKSIIEDNKGNLWLGTNKGLCEFFRPTKDNAKLVFRNYTIEDGAQSSEFNRRSCLKTSDGNLYFGGVNGFNIFNPEAIQTNPHIPNVVIVDFSIYNEPVTIGVKGSPLKQSISLTDKIELKYNQSVISFRFAALNYLSPEKNQYAYMMEGFEENWNYVSSKREATYTNLDPGKYIFRVKASNNDGIWNEKGVSINISILPPWWRTIFFRIIAILSLVSLVVGIFNYRLNNLKKQKVLLEKMVSDRTNELKQKNDILIEQTLQLNKSNILLENRQFQIEQQSNLLQDQRDELEKTNIFLNETNSLIEERQQQIEEQAEHLIQNNIELKKLNATKDKFFSIIAHDLKNPFNSIMGFSEMLYTNYNKYTERKRLQFVETIFLSSKKVYDLLEDLLQWARTQSGKIEYRVDSFNIKHIAENNIELLKDIINQKEIKIIKNLPENLVIHADRHIVNTIIRNLLSNAIKFTDKGQIEISSSYINNCVEIKISDTGIGIPPEKLGTLFDIGSSRTSEGTRGEIGTGLGLLICKEFIQKSNGTITVTSSPGSGTTFTVTIPDNKQ